MVELGKRRRAVIVDSDDDDFDAFLQESTPREIAIPVKKVDTPVTTLRETPPEDAKFWVESTFPL
jgi:hypothetical protein